MMQSQHLSQLSHGQLSPGRHSALLVLDRGDAQCAESLTRRERLLGASASAVWPPSNRNRGRLHFGTVAGIKSVCLAGMRRNSHVEDWMNESSATKPD
jgi:hypothetical protein